ncbi:mechanosensitive ion channel family protein [Ramlibacter sp.]|uniref:mechanosensitive ion channel family protein n=1 Tax=Ramlibacter sp. TaxID=1917967 RepID=UPI003D0B5F60
MTFSQLAALLQGHPWTLTLLFALAAVIAAGVAHRLVHAALRRVTRGRAVLRAIVEATQGAAAAAWPLAALQFVWLSAPDDLRYIARIQHLSGVLLIGALTWLVACAIRGVADGIVERNPLTVADNLHARRIRTQTEVLARTAMVIAVIAGTAIALLTFPGARQVGASLLASAGVLGIVGGLAARPVFSNLIAGLQIALAQPIRLDDVLIVNGEWGRVEEITGTYVVLRIWDERRLIIPLQWFIENPFQNWTRNTSQILGTIFVHVDYATPVEAVRAEAKRIAEASDEWDRRAFAVQVTDFTERTMQLRVLVSAGDAGKAFDLRCKLREGLIAFLAREYPACLPQMKVAQVNDPRLPVQETAQG